MVEVQQDWTQVANMSSYMQLSESFDVLLSNYSDIFKAELRRSWTSRPGYWSSQKRFKNSAKLELYPLLSKELLKGY